MKFSPGRSYTVGYVRELQLPRELRRLRTQFRLMDLYQYRGMWCVYGVTSSYQARVPELNRMATVPERPGSFVLRSNEPEPYVQLAIKELQGDEIYIEDPETLELDRVLNAGTCRGETCTGCPRYHGPMDPRAWTRADHEKCNRFVVDRYLAKKEDGSLARALLANP